MALSAPHTPVRAQLAVTALDLLGLDYTLLQGAKAQGVEAPARP